MKIVRLILKNLKTIIVIQILTVIIAVPVLLLLPKWYRSNTVFLVQTDKKDFNLNSAVTKLLPMGMGLDLNVEIQKYIGLLKSRNIADKIIERFNLQKAYQCKTRDDIYRELSNNVSFIDNNNGTITIYCLYKKDPQKAAEMANFYFQQLERLDTEISQKQANIFREMLENNYFERLSNYEKLQVEFSKYKQKYGILEIAEQTKLTLKTLSEMEMTKLQWEIKLDYLNHTQAASSPEIRNAKNQINSHQKEIDSFKNNNFHSNVAFNKISTQGIEYYKYSINLEIENKIIEFLTIQLEQAKIEENKILSNIVLLDQAIAPEKKFKPKRVSYLITIMFLNLLLTYLYFRYKDDLKRILG